MQFFVQNLIIRNMGGYKKQYITSKSEPKKREFDEFPFRDGFI